MFSNCYSSKNQQNNSTTQKEQNQNSMKTFFSLKRGKKNKSRTKRSSGNTKADVVKVEKSKTRKEIDQAEIMLKSIMAPTKTFEEALTGIVFEKSFDEAEKDVLRLIRKLVVEKKTKGNIEKRISFKEAEELVPEEVRNDKSDNQLRESCYLLMIFLQMLVDHFEEETIATEYKAKMLDLFNETTSNLTVDKFISIVGGVTSRSALVIKCLVQSVAITGHTHLFLNVCPLRVTDMSNHPRGWMVNVTLAESIQVTHVRRERGGNKLWQREFTVTMTFDREMTEIVQSQLAIIDLTFEEELEDEMKEYLNEKFGNGNIVIC